MEYAVNERIAELRKVLKLSQNDFAKRFDLTSAAISRIENKEVKPQQKTISAIARAFNVSMSWLIDGTGEMLLPGENFNQGTSRESVNPWENALVSELKEEVTFLRELLRNMTLAQANRAGVNFNSGADVAGFLREKLISSVRAAA